MNAISARVSQRGRWLDGRLSPRPACTWYGCLPLRPSAPGREGASSHLVRALLPRQTSAGVGVMDGMYDMPGLRPRWPVSLSWGEPADINSTAVTSPPQSKSVLDSRAQSLVPSRTSRLVSLGFWDGSRPADLPPNAASIIASPRVFAGYPASRQTPSPSHPIPSSPLEFKPGCRGPRQNGPSRHHPQGPRCRRQAARGCPEDFAAIPQRPGQLHHQRLWLQVCRRGSAAP